MDDLGVPLFSETSMYHLLFRKSCLVRTVLKMQLATGRCLATGTTYCSLKVTTTRDKRIPKWILTQSKQGHRYALKGNDASIEVLERQQNQVNSRLYHISNIYNLLYISRCHCGQADVW